MKVDHLGPPGARAILHLYGVFLYMYLTETRARLLYAPPIKLARCRQPSAVHLVLPLLHHVAEAHVQGRKEGLQVYLVASHVGAQPLVALHKLLVPFAAAGVGAVVLDAHGGRLHRVSSAGTGQTMSCNGDPWTRLLLRVSDFSSDNRVVDALPAASWLGEGLERRFDVGRLTLQSTLAICWCRLLVAQDFGTSSHMNLCVPLADMIWRCHNPRLLSAKIRTSRSLPRLGCAAKLPPPETKVPHRTSSYSSPRYLTISYLGISL